MSDQLAARPARRKPRRLPRGLGIAIVAVVLLALVLALVVGGRSVLSRFGSSETADYAGEGTGSAVVQVQEGDSASAVGTTLEQKGVVKSAAAFRAAAAAEPKSRGLQPGFYRLRERMSAKSALALLLDPASRMRGSVTVPEGTPLSQTLKLLAKETEIPIKDFEAAARNPDDLGLPTYAKGKLEGFLFPATYDVEPGSSAADVLKMMVDRYNTAAEDLDLTSRAQELGRTPYELLITASLIEKETPYPADRPKVARVVYNRLEAGMPLQFDSTVNYVREERAARLSLSDIKVDSPYNTYTRQGLPPTPIDSPGAAALEAAFTPASGDFLYFVTIDKQGRSLFTSDYQAFLDAKAKAKREGVY